MIRVVEYAVNAPLRKGDARIRHRGPGSRRTNCELYGSSPTHSPYNRWLRDDWWFHIPSFPLIQFYTCITGNLPWPTAGNTETGGRQKRTTLCWGDYEVQVQRATTDLYKVRRDIWYRTRDWYANGLIITYQSLPEGHEACAPVRISVEKMDRELIESVKAFMRKALSFIQPIVQPLAARLGEIGKRDLKRRVILSPSLKHK